MVEIQWADNLTGLIVHFPLLGRKIRRDWQEAEDLGSRGESRWHASASNSSHAKQYTDRKAFLIKYNKLCVIRCRLVQRSKLGSSLQGLQMWVCTGWEAWLCEDMVGVPGRVAELLLASLVRLGISKSLR
jgi:hypothetical protein